MEYYVYIMASKRHGTLYIGVTSDLIRGVHEHKTNRVEGFTRLCGVHHLVCFESVESIETAILREKQLNKWNRAWRAQLIEKNNPSWRDPYSDLLYCRFDGHVNPR